MKDLMEEIVELSNLVTALKRVVSNGGNPGTDWMTESQLKEWFNHN